MICPILSQQVKFDQDDINEMIWTECQKDNCQWWINGNCIIYDLNRSLKDIVSELNILTLSRKIRK